MTGADVKALRLRTGLTQQAFADVLGVAQGTVSRWERRGTDDADMNSRRLLVALAAGMGRLPPLKDVYAARGGLYVQYLLLQAFFS